MRPGHIRVFDGLRVTTEHMEHLQSSFHSAIQDIREILGLGVVHSGFEVVYGSPSQVVVQPGIAFDYERNRIVNDEPKTIDVAFEGEQSEAIICVQYNQIQDGNIEGQFTLVWDSCSIKLFPSLPPPEESCIPIALIEKTGDETGLRILSFAQPLEEAEAQQGSGENDEATEPVVEPDAEASTEETPESPQEETVAESEESPRETAPPLEAPAYEYKCAQGFTELASEGENNLRTLILDPLLGKFQSGNEKETTIELLLPVSSKMIELSFASKSITTHTIMDANLKFEDLESDSQAGSPKHELQSISHGEVSISDSSVSQFALTTFVQARPPVFEQQGIASLPFNGVEYAGELFAHVLQSLKFVLSVTPVPAGIEAQLNLCWSGNVTKELLTEIESKKCSLTWMAKFAWKSSGRTN